MPQKRLVSTQGQDLATGMGAGGPKGSRRDGQVVPQQWLAHTTAPNVDPADRRRLDLVIYGATPLGRAFCCDATLVSPLIRTGQPKPCAAAKNGAALRMAERRKRAAYPEFSMGGAQRLVVLGTEVGGRWSKGALRLVRDLVRVRAQRSPPALRTAAGREGGGPSWQSQCSRPLLPQHWAIRGWCRLAPAKSMAPSSTRFSTWPSRRDPADCRCGRQPPTKTRKKVRENNIYIYIYLLVSFLRPLSEQLFASSRHLSWITGYLCYLTRLSRGCEVEHALQQRLCQPVRVRWRWPRLAERWPRAAGRRACNRLLDRDSQHTPPTPRPPRSSGCGEVSCD